MNTLSCADIAGRGRELEQQFAVVLTEPDELLQCEQILRLLPGRRVACRAQWRGQEVLAKLFVDPRGWKRHLAREVAGSEALRNAGVPTPRILQQGQHPSGGWLLTEFLGDAVSLEQSWEQAVDDTTRLQVLEQAMGAVARMHVRGLYQDDIHLGNFLCHGDDVFCIDGASVVSVAAGRCLAAGDATPNLALLIAQLFPRFESLALRAFPVYLAESGGRIPITESELRSAVRVARRNRAQHYESKLFRDCTQFHCEQSWHHFAAAERELFSPAVAAWLRQPDTPFAGAELLKDGNSSTVCRMEIDARPLVVKRYNIKSLWHAILRALQPTRAWISWRNGHMLRHFGLPTPRPVVMLERRWGWLRSRAWIVTEAVRGPHALEQLADAQVPAATLELAVSAIRDIFLAMIAARYSHGDLKATNIIMSDAGPVLIDLDAARRHGDARSFVAAFAKDLARFMRNWPEDSPAREAFVPVEAEMLGLLEELKKDHG